MTQGNHPVTGLQTPGSASTVPELVPCPHCEAPGYFVWNRTQSRGRVKCTRPSCGAAGGEFEQRSVAIAAWNTRPAADALATLRADGMVEDEAVFLRRLLTMSAADQYRPAMRCLADIQAQIRARFASLIAASPAPPSDDGWRPIETAPKDGTRVLVHLHNPLPVEGRSDLDPWHGIPFVARHTGVEDDGFDIGWQFAAPVGQGGFPDKWIAGWRPLPAPPSVSGEE